MTKTDPFKLLDMVEAQRKRADSQEDAHYKATVTLLDVLAADTLEDAQAAASAYLADIRIMGQPANELDERADKLFRHIVASKAGR